MMLSVSVCVCAYNEEENIERAIRSVYSQRTDVFDLSELFVMSSGSTDGTDDIVQRMIDEFPSLVLVRQKERKGKNSAINEFLDMKRGDVCVLMNADNILRDELSLHNLVSPFKDEKVGMAGGRPVPTNDTKGYAGFASHMIWSMHHYISLIEPKIGELVAFRDIGTRLPEDMQSDEDIIKMELEKNGYGAVYAPDAVVLNRGPDTVGDFLKQRVRVNIGEEYMKKKFGYSFSTHNNKLLMNAVLGSMRDLGPHPVKMSIAIALEMISRRKAKAYVNAGKDDMNVWSRVDSTKDVKR
jgi:cellulose synthase/poly-beta-1,6-N-acetylglucosamine synthase-like glycosyltransferase